MDNKTNSIKVLILLVFIIFISGCTATDNITGLVVQNQSNEDTSNKTINNNPTLLEMTHDCAQLEGYICDSKEDCALPILNATEDNCCPIQCNVCPENISCDDNDNNTQDICIFDNGTISYIYEKIISENTTEENSTPTSIFLSGSSSGGSSNEKQEPEIIETPSCPSSCDDYNKCTNDSCSESTNYLCAHDIIYSCCGNDLCEQQQDYLEDYLLCPTDCQGKIVWNQMSTPNSVIRSIHMLSSDEGYAVGGEWSDTHIYKFNGSTWIDMPDPAKQYLTSIFMLSSNEGYATGNYGLDNGGPILKYNGSTWDFMTNYDAGITKASYYKLKDIYMLNSNEGYAVGTSGADYGPVILNYTESVWSRIFIPNISQDISSFTSVQALSQNEVYITGYFGIILKYNGSEWYEMQTPLTNHIQKIKMLSSDEGYAIDTNGNVLKYINGLWNIMPIPESVVILESGNDIAVLSSNEIYVLGEKAGWILRPVILKYNGSDWSEMPNAANDYLQTLSIVSSNKGYAGGAEGIFEYYPSCGNNICEAEESYTLCPKDCENPCPISCDDGDMYTLDYCNEITNYQCDHINIGCIDNDGICAKGCTYYQYDNDCSQIQRIEYGGDYHKQNIQIDETYIYLTSSYYKYTPPSENYIKIYNKTSLKLVKTINFSSYHPNTAEIGALHVDDNKIYAGSVDGELKIYNKTDFSFISQISNLSTAYYRTPVGITTDNENIYIAIASDMGESYNILIYNKSNYSFTNKISAHTELIYYFDVDEKYIYSSSNDRTIKIWNKTSNELIKLLPQTNYNVIVRMDKDYIYILDIKDASSTTNNIKIIKKTDFNLEKIITLGSGFWHGMVIDDNYIYIGTGLEPSKIKVWDKTKGMFVQTLYGDTESPAVPYFIKEYIYLLDSGRLTIWKNNMYLNSTYISYFQIPDFEPIELYWDYESNTGIYKLAHKLSSITTTIVTTETYEMLNGLCLIGSIKNIENSIYAKNYANILINDDIFTSLDYNAVRTIWNTTENHLLKLNCWKPTSGNYTVKLIADPLNKIKESNEENNILTRNITVINNSLSPEIINVIDSTDWYENSISYKTKCYLTKDYEYLYERNISTMTTGDNITFYVNASDPDGNDNDLLYDFSVMYENISVNMCSWNSSNVCNLTITNEMINKTILITIAIRDNDNYYYSYNESLGDDYTFMRYLL